MPERLAADAKRAALRRFPEAEDSHLTAHMRRRIAAYFWGTVRRRAVRHEPGYARTLVRATLAADLAEAGWEAPAIRVELEKAGLLV